MLAYNDVINYWVAQSRAQIPIHNANAHIKAHEAGYYSTGPDLVLLLYHLALARNVPLFLCAGLLFHLCSERRREFLENAAVLFLSPTSTIDFDHRTGAM